MAERSAERSVVALDAAVSGATLGAVVKYREDAERVRAHGLEALLADAEAVARG